MLRGTPARRLCAPVRAQRWTAALVIGMALACLATACGDPASTPASMLNTAGPGANRVEHLWWLLFGISTAVFLFVAALIAAAIVRRRRPSAGDPSTDPGAEEVPRWGERFILVGGVVVPVLILSATFVLTLHEMSALAKPMRTTRLSVRVVGHLWWWEARYPNGAVTANEIHIPVGEPVRVELTTADVIHSFWVPELQTKIDQIPGHTNELWLQADKQGRYRGQCSQFCGLQHAHMIFFVVADPPALFQAWESGQAAPAAAPMSPAAAGGLAVFTSNTCAGCHAIRGTSAAATVGPDLTHVAGRATIASGTIDNTPANLAHWITDPQEVKPGAIMPPTQLSPTDLQDLVAYLQSLP
ncbi:MAG TPA: cytochrome c oxidase subunit II [Actinomycetota bacterium]|nr:cytochrome c oxidase subunit II [Actinomycetota bacterium]